MHHVPDEHLITPALLRRAAQEGEFEDGNGQHFLLIQKSDRDFIGHNPYSPELGPDQMIWGQDILGYLNTELHHDGAWVLVFTNPKTFAESLTGQQDYRRFAVIFLDRDGDAQFTVEWVEHESHDLYDFADVMLAGRDWLVAFCEAGWRQWHMIIHEALAPAENQLRKAAQGQTKPN